MSKEVDALRGVLSAEFEPAQVLHFEGRGGRIFDYVEDETVMDRLEDALGIGSYDLEFSPVTDSCVKGRLAIRWPDGTTSSYEDFGYATRTDSAEPYKEAVSDAIRRLGRYVGVARYLYRKHESPAASAGRVPSSSRPASRPTVVREEPDDPFGEFAPIGGKSAPAEIPTDECPIHGVPWNGEPGDQWHRKDEGGFCRHPDNVRKARRA